MIIEITTEAMEVQRLRQWATRLLDGNVTAIHGQHWRFLEETKAFLEQLEKEDT